MADDYREVFWKGVTQIDVEIYEECLFIRIPSDSEYPEFEFRVSSKNGKTGEVVSQLSIRVRADEEIWDYVQKHPLWHKDPRPLLLVTIYDLLWRIKLAPTHVGEPFKRSFALGAIQGGTIYAEIVAEVFVDFGGVHVIHLANYANTHLLDQLEAVYKQNPKARPSEKYSESVMDRFHKDHVNAKIHKQKIQAQRRKLRNRSKPKHDPVKIFVDESGDIGFRRLDEPYVLCAYVVPDAAVSNVEAELRGILSRHWSTPPKELHFNKIPPSRLAGVLLDTSRVLQSNPGFCVCLIGTKHGFLAYLSRSEAELHKHDEKPIKTSWAYKLADTPTGLARATLIFILEELLIHIAAETVDLQTPMEILHDRKHREWMNEALETAFKRSELGIKAHSQEFYGRGLPLKRTFKLVESAEQPCLWVPDWICWEVARWWKENTWSEEFEQSLDKITFITFDQIGTKVRTDKPGGTLVAEFPDSPRDVESI